MVTPVIAHRKFPSDEILSPDLHPLLNRIFLARGVKHGDEIVNDLDRLIPFSELKSIEAAADLIHEQLANNHRILVIGDFDADGATSTALAVSVLRAFGAEQVNFLVPNRFEFGYGLTPEIVEVGARWKPDLMITVDNGIANHEGVKAAKERGIHVLITDHHLPAETLPDADVIVNPNQPGCHFPSKNLAGVGVIFYVMLALRAKLRAVDWFREKGIDEPSMSQWLDLVALGTVADVVPLDHNNRVLVQQGLRRIRAGRAREGILALLQVAGRDYRRITSGDLGFAVGPRLNAAGRLDEMSEGIECLLAEDPDIALSMAKDLDALNRERRLIENRMREEAMAALEALSLPPSLVSGGDANQSNQANQANQIMSGICLFSPQWHQGVIGILASRIKERYHRPVIAFARASQEVVGEIKGSARSITGVNIRDMLALVDTRYPGLILRFGGHAMAAGLAIREESFAQFKQAFEQVLSDEMDEEVLQNRLQVDGELPIEDFSLPTARLLKTAGPWGQHFPEPSFVGEFKLLDQRLVGGNHLKMTVSLEGLPCTLDAIAFSVDTDKWPNFELERVKLVYRLDVNEYQGTERLQLLVEELLTLSN